MNLSDINTKLSTESGADTNTYPNTERVIDINNAGLKLQSMILDSQDEADFDDVNHGDFPILTVPLTTNQSVSIPQSERVISIKKLSVTYNGVDFYEAKPIDSGEVDGVLQVPSTATVAMTSIDSNFSRTAPRYDWKYGSLFVYPRASTSDVVAGAAGIIEWNRDVYQFTSSELGAGALVPGIDSAFHPYLFLEPAFNWCSAKGKSDRLPSLKARMDDIEFRLRKQYGKKQRDRRMSIGAMIKNYR
jgi:hypothetical protein